MEDQLQTTQEYTTSLMFTSRIYMFCLKPIKFSLNTIQHTQFTKYNFNNNVEAINRDFYRRQKWLSINRHFNPLTAVSRSSGYKLFVTRYRQPAFRIEHYMQNGAVNRCSG